MEKHHTSLETNQEQFVHKWPFFYGWVIMVVGTLGMIMTSPGQTYTESIFIEFLIEEIQISRSLISSLYSFGTLVGGFSLPLIGKQIDRHGTRKTMTLVAILFGLACIYMGFVQNAWMIGLGFIMVRTLGQGSLGLISQTAINQWWVQKRGVIMGISGLVMALLGMGAFPSLVHWLIAITEWRLAYIILGLSLLFIMAPLGFLFIRNRPEDFGLQPDGAAIKFEDIERFGFTPSPEPKNWTLKEAMRTPAFWIIASSITLFAMLITGLTFHLVDIFKTQSLSASAAASVFIPIAITAALTNFIAGYLSDYIPLKILMAIGLIVQALSLYLATILQGAGLVLFFGVMLGLANGLIRAVSQIVWPTFYGRENLGSILGFTSAMSIIGAAIGPLPFGIVYDLTGDYRWVLTISAAVSLVLGGINFTIQKPQKKA
jgi:sugar phosphate permease